MPRRRSPVPAKKGIQKKRRERRVVACLRGNLRRLISTPRVWAALILLFLLCVNQLSPVLAMLSAEGTNISVPGMIAYLLSDASTTLLTSVLLLMLLMDMPMIDETQRYIITRAGRASWAKGQVWYVWVGVGLFLTLMVGFCFILLARFATAEGWGTGLIALAQDRLYEAYDSMIEYDPWLMRAYQPIPAMLIALSLRYLALVALGLLMCAVNAAFRTRLGMIFAAIPVLLDMVAYEYLPAEAYWALPVTLSRLSMLDYGDEMGRPPLMYAFWMLVGLCVLLGFVTAKLCGRRELNL